MKADLTREQLMQLANDINSSYETEPLKALRKSFKGMLVSQIALGISQVLLIAGVIVYEVAGH